MTIHSCKGLEFDAVVVPLRSGQGASLTGQTPNVVTGRSSPTEPIDLVTRYVNKQTQAILPKPVQKCFANQQSQVVRESMCLLYVALTRAVHATHVILSPDTKATSPSASGVVLATVADADFDKETSLTVHESGNLTWFESYADEQPSADSNESKDADFPHFELPVDATLSDAASSDVSFPREVRSGRGTANRYPSAKPEFPGTTFGDQLQQRRHSNAANMGSLIHACFEQVEWLDKSDPPGDDALVARLRQIDPDLENGQAAIKAFRHSIDQPNINMVLNHDTQLSKFNGERLAVMTEYQFAVKTDTGILSGTIDRLVLSFDGDQIVEAEIVDFKSDLVTSATASDRADDYRSQMNAYAEAVTKAFSLTPKQVRQTIAFTQTDQLIQLDTTGDRKSTTKKLKPKQRSPESDAAGETQQRLW